MLQVEVDYSCGGCDAHEKVKAWVKNEFRSFSGRDHGFGTYHLTEMKDVIDSTCPEGWIAFDPYTQATYCPKCWSELVEGWKDSSNAD